jgi:segregation and condensation protein B
MSQEGKSSMGPPRLTVVEKAGAEAAADESGRALARDEMNDVSPPGSQGEPVPGDMATGSPVHDLIQTIEAGTSGHALDQAVAGAGTMPSKEEAPVDPERAQRLRVLEAVIFASAEPVEDIRLETYLKPGEVLHAMLDELQAAYAGRGVNLVKIAGKWAFRTAEDLSWALERHAKLERRLSKAGLETLAIVAYHQPVTRAEIEEVRGVTISKGTLDVLMEVGWVRPRGRRRAPGKPITYGTTERFLEHFGLEAIKDLPGLSELKASGLLDANLPPDFKVPEPTDIAALMPDELPLEAAEDGDEQLQGVLELEDLGEDDDGIEDGDIEASGPVGPGAGEDE